MANIAFVRSALGTGSGVTLSAAPTQGDALIAIAFQSGTGSWTVGSGWTQITAATGTNGGSAAGGSAFWKIAGASESATQRPITAPTASCVVIFEFSAVSGFSASNPIDTANFTGGSSATPSSVTCSSLTPARANEALIVAGYDNTTGDSSPSSIAGCSGLVTLSGGDTSGNGAAAYEIPGNAFGQSKTITWTGSTAGKASGIQIFLAPLAYTSTESGSVTGSGSASKKGELPVTGSVTNSGSFSRAIGGVLTGSITATGAFVRFIGAQLAAMLTPTGSFVRSIVTGVLGTGTIAAVGVVAKTLQRTVTGTVSAAATLARSSLLALTGSVTGSGALSRAIGAVVTGTINATGSFTRYISAFIAGSITSTGTLTRAFVRALFDSIAPEGSVVRSTLKALEGSVLAAGTITRTIGAALNAVITGTGNIGRNIAALLSAVLSPTGTFTRSITRALNSAITSVGKLTRAPHQFLLNLSASISGTGTLARTTLRQIAASVTATGTIPGRIIGVALNAVIAPVGSIRRFMLALLRGVVNAIGLLGVLPPRKPVTVYVTLPIVVGEAFAFPIQTNAEPVTLAPVVDAACSLAMVPEVAVALAVVDAVEAA